MSEWNDKRGTLKQAEALLAHAELIGFRLVPLMTTNDKKNGDGSWYGGKRPVGANWGERVYKAGDFIYRHPKQYGEAHVEAGDMRNRGLLLDGDKSRMMDIDLDSPEAIEAAGEHFGDLKLLEFGRGGVRTHMLFRAAEGTIPDDLPQKYEGYLSGDDGQQRTACELRCGGEGKQTQTMIPRSIHPDTGEKLEWMCDAPKSYEDVPEIDFGEILKRFDAMCAAIGVRMGWKSEAAPQADYSHSKQWDDDGVADRIREALSLSELAEQIAGDKSVRRGDLQQCPVCQNGGKPVLSVHDGDKFGYCFWDGCPTRSWSRGGFDVFHLIAWHENLDIASDFQKVLKSAADFAGIDYEPKPPRKAKAKVKGKGKAKVEGKSDGAVGRKKSKQETGYLLAAAKALVATAEDSSEGRQATARALLKELSKADIDTDLIAEERLAAFIGEAVSGRLEEFRFNLAVSALLNPETLEDVGWLVLPYDTETMPTRKMLLKRVSAAVNIAMGKATPDADSDQPSRFLLCMPAGEKRTLWWQLTDSGCWERLGYGSRQIAGIVSDSFALSPPQQVKMKEGSLSSEFGDVATRAYTTEALHHLNELAFTPAMRHGRVAEEDMWLPQHIIDGTIRDAHRIPFSDVAVRVESDGSTTAEAHNPLHFYPVSKGYRWAGDEEIDTPLFDSCLEIMDADGNEGASHLVMLFLGQLVAGENPHRKIFMPIGQKRTMKSTLGNLATALAGVKASAEFAVVDFGDKFVARQVFGLQLIKFLEIDDRPVGSERNKYNRGLYKIKGELVGGDMMEGRDMYSQENFTFKMGPVNVFMTSNDAPRFATDKEGDAGAWRDRLIPIALVNTLPPSDRRDTHADDIIATELPAVARKCLEYWLASEERETGIYNLPFRSLKLLQEIAGSDFSEALDALAEDEDSVLYVKEMKALVAVCLGEDNTSEVSQRDYRRFRAAVIARFPDAETDFIGHYQGKRAKGIRGIYIWHEGIAGMVNEMLTPQSELVFDDDGSHR